jgi:hypothetical protein
MLINPIIRTRTRNFHHAYPRHVTILSSHLRLGLRSGLFPSDIPTKTLYAVLVSMHTTYLVHLIPIYFIILICYISFYVDKIRHSCFQERLENVDV